MPKEVDKTQYGPFAGDKRKTISASQATQALTRKQCDMINMFCPHTMSLTRAQAQRTIHALNNSMSGASHSAHGSTLWVSLCWAWHFKLMFNLTAYYDNTGTILGSHIVLVTRLPDAQD